MRVDYWGVPIKPIDWHKAFFPPRHFPKGHIREYDPDGIYTYKDQNPKYKEQ